MSTTVAYQRRTGSLTVIRWMFAVYFIGVGIAHFVVPAGLPPFMSWMYELSDGLHAVSGAAEVLGGLGLVLPRLTGVAPRFLTTAAASGLVLTMLGAAVWHSARGEWTQIVANLVVAAIMAYVAFREWRTPTSFPADHAQPDEGMVRAAEHLWLTGEVTRGPGIPCSI